MQAVAGSGRRCRPMLSVASATAKNTHEILTIIASACDSSRRMLVAFWLRAQELGTWCRWSMLAVGAGRADVGRWFWPRWWWLLMLAIDGVYRWRWPWCCPSMVLACVQTCEKDLHWKSGAGAGIASTRAPFRFRRACDVFRWFCANIECWRRTGDGYRWRWSWCRADGGRWFWTYRRWPSRLAVVELVESVEWIPDF